MALPIGVQHVVEPRDCLQIREARAEIEHSVGHAGEEPEATASCITLIGVKLLDHVCACAVSTPYKTCLVDDSSFRFSIFDFELQFRGKQGPNA